MILGQLRIGVRQMTSAALVGASLILSAELADLNPSLPSLVLLYLLTRTIVSLQPLFPSQSACSIQLFFRTAECKFAVCVCPWCFVYEAITFESLWWKKHKETLKLFRALTLGKEASSGVGVGGGFIFIEMKTGYNFITHMYIYLDPFFP